MIIQRILQIWRALIGSGLARLETDHAEEMLGLEREQLCARISRYNQGLAGHAALSERLKAQLKKLAQERDAQRAGLASRLVAGERAKAGRHALRIEAIDQESREHTAQLTETEASYRELVSARETALAAARDKIEGLNRSIGEYKMQKALAGLTELAAGMHGSLGLSAGTLDRVKERVDEQRHLAAGRTRVARESIDVIGVRICEAERESMAQLALERFERSLGAGLALSAATVAGRTTSS
jgi:hypothetical protein